MSSAPQSLAAGPSLIRVVVRPATIYISRGRGVFAAQPDGFILGQPEHGYFVHETRLLSRWRYLIDGAPPEPNVLSTVRQHAWLGYYTFVAPGAVVEEDTGSGHVPAESRKPVELRVTRVISDGLQEDLHLTNYAGQATSFVLSIEAGADFADLAETRMPHPPESVQRTWRNNVLTFDYVCETLHRSVNIEIDSETPCTHEDGRLSFRVSLEPRQQWHARITFTPVIDGKTLMPDGDHLDDAIRRFLDRSTLFEAPGTNTFTSDVLATLEQARADLAALRLFDLDRGDHAWTVAAGLPMYIALFGRDTLTTGWQAGPIAPDLMRGALQVLAESQGTRVDDWRDEQPGRMLHEAHTGPSSMLDKNPRARSYSSVTTSGLYAFIVAELWHWTGDKEIVRPFVEPALRALHWTEKYGDLDGDGFYEYKTRSPQGTRNQAWKDSPDAMVYEDGTLVEPPIATCEEQAFVYAAKFHFSFALWFLGEHDLAKRLFHEASELKKRFNEAFWMEDEGIYAMALDPQKRQVRSIASNAGHCIAAGITESSFVPRMTERLFKPDLFSGWGIRTLSSDHPSYNPYSYHLGSVWPVEHGTFALGFMRYGLYDALHQLARAQFDAASLFEFHRLPELFAGHPRDHDHPFPAIYQNASSPQAWSASSVFSLLQALLGLYPFAPLKMLVIDPHLPEWLPEITLRDLRVGKARITIRFRRGANGRTTWRVLDREGTLHVVRQPTPWSLTAGPLERIADAISSLAGGAI